LVTTLYGDAFKITKLVWNFVTFVSTIAIITQLEFATGLMCRVRVA